MKGEIDSNTVTVGDFNTPLTSIDRSLRQKINKKTVVLNDTLDRWATQIYTENSAPKQQNTHSFQVHMIRTPGQITFQTTEQVSINLRSLKSFKACFLTMGRKLEINYKKKKLEETQTQGS